MIRVPVEEAKVRLEELLASLEGQREPVLITREGAPAAVLLGLDAFESMEETMYWLPYLDEVRAALAEPRVSVTREELLRRIASRAEPR